MPYTQIMDAVYFPGDPADPKFPLARFLPPLELGSAARTVAAYSREGDTILDPFGTSPHLVVEAAKEDRAVLVAASNPVLAFLIESLADPRTQDELRAALGYLAALPKNSTRLEPFLLDLYRTDCLHCGHEVSAEYFVWDRDLHQILSKAYTCDGCQFAGEVMASEADQQRADAFSSHGLHRSLALDRIVGTDDPDREGADRALDAYLPRALYALVTILTKLDQFLPPDHLRVPLKALLLSAVDAGTILWGHPEGRPRPRALTASPLYHEWNIWRAMERSMPAWLIPGSANPVRLWDPQVPLEPGSIAIFPGPVRDLLPQLPAETINMVFTVPPRQNQAFWTLSALWSAWIWGKERARSARSALRRRRYDWNWHAAALRNVFQSLGAWRTENSSMLTLLPEAEPGYLAAVLSAMAGSGEYVQGAALRMEDQQAFQQWSRMATSRGVKDGIFAAAARAVDEVLAARGEPVSYPVVHGYVGCALEGEGVLDALWKESPEAPINPFLDALHTALDHPQRIRRLKGGSERERHVYVLPAGADAAVPLMDRVEQEVLQVLRTQRFITLLDVEVALCAALPGVLTPDRRLIERCLSSYAQEQDEVWQLRREDEKIIRDADVEDVYRRLLKMGAQLTFQTMRKDHVVEWSAGRKIYQFLVQPTALIREFLRYADDPHFFLVIPGGRSRLIMEKARRDPRLEARLEAGGGLIKFRHIRRLAEEGLEDRSFFFERLLIDPPAYDDPQLPLL